MMQAKRIVLPASAIEEANAIQRREDVTELASLNSVLEWYEDELCKPLILVRDSTHIDTIRVRVSHYRMCLERPQQPLFIANLRKIGKKWEAKCFDNHRLEGWTLRGVERMVRDYWDENLTKKNNEKENHH